MKGTKTPFVNKHREDEARQQHNLPRKRKKGWILIISGVLVILAALALTGYNLWDDMRAGRSSDQVLIKIKEIREKNNNGNNTDIQDDGSGANGSIIPGIQDTVIPDYILNPDMDLPAVEIDGRRYVGTLAIPSLEIELPVLEEWSYPGLKIAPGKYQGTPYKNNLIIAAHNYDTHFGRIKELLEGDEILFVDMDGNTFRYKVALVDTLGPYAVEEMKSGGWALTLFTCTIGGQMRVTVRCNSADG